MLLGAFDLSLGGSTELPEPPLDPPQISLSHFPYPISDLTQNGSTIIPFGAAHTSTYTTYIREYTLLPGLIYSVQEPRKKTIIGSLMIPCNTNIPDLNYLQDKGAV